MLIEVFPEKLESVSGLSDSDKADYIKRNDQAVHDYVIPAYQSLIKGMEALKGSGTNENGLCYFDHGKEYYEYLVKSQTGSDKSPEELIEWLDDTLQNTMVQMHCFCHPTTALPTNWMKTLIFQRTTRRLFFKPFNPR